MENLEIAEIDFFRLDELPPLSTHRVTKNNCSVYMTWYLRKIEPCLISQPIGLLRNLVLAEEALSLLTYSIKAMTIRVASGSKNIVTAFLTPIIHVTFFQAK